MLRIEVRDVAVEVEQATPRDLARILQAEARVPQELRGRFRGWLKRMRKRLEQAASGRAVDLTFRWRQFQLPIRIRKVAEPQSPLRPLRQGADVYVAPSGTGPRPKTTKRVGDAVVACRGRVNVWGTREFDRRLVDKQLEVQERAGQEELLERWGAKGFYDFVLRLLEQGLSPEEVRAELTATLRAEGIRRLERLEHERQKNEEMALRAMVEKARRIEKMLGLARRPEPRVSRDPSDRPWPHNRPRWSLARLMIAVWRSARDRGWETCESLLTQAEQMGRLGLEMVVRGELTWNDVGALAQEGWSGVLRFLREGRLEVVEAWVREEPKPKKDAFRPPQVAPAHRDWERRCAEAKELARAALAGDAQAREKAIPLWQELAETAPTEQLRWACQSVVNRLLRCSA